MLYSGQLKLAMFVLEYFLEIIRRHALEPYLKYQHPDTEGQEYGWNHKPLVSGKAYHWTSSQIITALSRQNRYWLRFSY